MRSDWIRRLISTLMVLLAGCITYKPQRVVIPKGGRVKIVSGYEETLNFYDVTAFFTDSASVKSSTSIDEADDRHREILTLSLVPGQHTVLTINGQYQAIPGMLDVPVESYSLIIMLDTLCVNDTIQLTSDSIELYFHHLGLGFDLIQESYTTELEGYLVIDSLKDNTVSGTVRFFGEAIGYYHSTKITDDEVESWVSGDIRFTAVKQEVKQDSMVVGRTLADH
jgi:hypothetical protein